jgi:hypothetical protein
MSHTSALWVMAALLGVSAIAYSQTTYATITGTVTDSSGAIVPRAKITATNTQTNVQSTTSPNQEGNYTIPQLIEGTYVLKAEAAGFADFTVPNIQLVSRDLRRVDVSMTVGVTTESIQVSAGGSTVIETDTSRIDDTKDVTTLNIMPLNARWVWAYLEQIPGMVASGGSYRMGGAPITQTNYAIDGTTMNDGQGNAIGPQMNYMEYIQELRSNVANNSAEFATVGQVEAITKSGTNQLHGAAYDTFYTPGLRARDFFATSVSTSRYHILGGSIGGPVVIPKLYHGKNRTFFFGSFERSAGNVNVTPLNPTVPTQAFRNGDFSSLLPGTAIYDPTTNQPFPNNQIPARRINPVSQKIQDEFYPLPNFGDPTVFQTSNFRQLITQPWTAPWLLTTRVDQYFSQKDFVYGRFMMTGVPVKWYDDNLPTIGADSEYRRTASATVSYTHTFRPNITNEARWGMDYNNLPSAGPVNGQQQVGLLGLTGLAPNLPNVPGMLNVYWDGVGLQPLEQWNGANPGYRNHNEEFQDFLTIFHGRHTIKAGLDFVRVEGDNNTIPADLFGTETFSNRFTSGGIAGQGFPYADFLLGIPTTSSRSYPALLLQDNRWQYAGFVTDEFKVNPRLTLTVGLRYQLHTPWSDNSGRISVFDVNTGTIVVPDSSIGQVSPLFPTSYVKVVSASSAGLPNTLIHADTHNFAPRVGLAWRPFGEHTVLRAGFGIYYDPVPPNLSTAGSPFQLHEPAYTNPENDPQVILPQVFPTNPGAEGLSQVSLPNAVDPNLKTPRTYQYNATIERQQWDTGFRISYIGTAVRQVNYFYNYNSPVPNDLPYIDKPRAFMQYPDIMYETSGGGGQYNALSAEVKRPLAKGLFFQFSWTWARDIYDVTEGGTITDPYNRSLDRGVAPDIPTHRIVMNMYYELPFGRGKPIAGNVSRLTNLVVGGWVFSTTWGFQTGQFLTPLWSGPDPTGTVYTSSSTPAYVTIRPDQIGNPNAGPQTISQWFNPGAFAAPQLGQYGNASQGAIKGPPVNTWNAGIQKQLFFREKAHLTLEFTSRNVFNHPNWSNPNTNISNVGSVGVITYAGGVAFNSYEREERLGLRLEF